MPGAYPRILWGHFSRRKKTGRSGVGVDKPVRSTQHCSTRSHGFQWECNTDHNFGTALDVPATHVTVERVLSALKLVLDYQTKLPVCHQVYPAPALFRYDAHITNILVLNCKKPDVPVFLSLLLLKFTIYPVDIPECALVICTALSLLVAVVLWSFRTISLFFF